MTPTRIRAPKKGREDVLARELRKREREVLLEYLERHNGNITATAEALGLSSDRTLYAKLVAHELQELASELRAKAGIRGPR